MLCLVAGQPHLRCFTRCRVGSRATSSADNQRLWRSKSLAIEDFDQVRDSALLRVRKSNERPQRR